MATNEEKLSKFNAAINHYAEEQRNKIEQEVEEFKQQELADAETEVLGEAYHLIQKEMAEMRNKITREMAHREMDARKDLLSHRQKITDEVFKRAAKELLAYTGDASYAQKLKKWAEELSSAFAGASGNTVLCMRSSDIEKHRELVEKAFGGPCEIKSDDDIAIGGIRAYNTQMGIMADDTLDSMLADQHDWFEENAGMSVV